MRIVKSDVKPAQSKLEYHVISLVQSKNQKYAHILNQNEQIDREYGEENKEEMLNVQTIIEKQPKKKYPSGAGYEGEWSEIGWEGHGKYVFPHGVTYTGQFKDTRFNGHGILQYPMGQKLGGTWSDGILVSWHYKFSDGLDYHEPWSYCKFPDRRYYQTILHGFCAPDKERICNAMPPRKIPDGCYDVGEGFYNPKTKCIVSVFDLNKVIRIPSQDEEQWIQKHCRKAWDEPVGYRPQLYEHWTTGARESTSDILQEIQGCAPEWRNE